MNKTDLCLTLAATLLLAPTTSTLAESPWETVADFQSTTGLAAVDALAKDGAGNLYAAVSTSDAQARMHALVRKSSDRGATWTVVEDFVSAAHGAAKFLGLGTDSAGHLYAAGYVEDEHGQTRWIVRKSGQDGGAWSTVDDFTRPGGQTAVAQDFVADAAGNLYVTGFGEEPASDSKPGQRSHWLVRQSRDGGRSWSTIDDFGYSFSARAAAIVITRSGLFVAGSGWNGKSESGERWLVRHGTDEGAGGFRWQTVDEFQMKEHGHGYDSRAHGLAVDNRGNLYAVGRSYAVADGGISAHWIVRRASSAGSDWSVVDMFQLDPGNFAAARGVAAAGEGGVYVVGQAGGSNPGLHWTVRQSASGEAGSWSASDDFQVLSTPPAVSKAAAPFIKMADGSLSSWPAKNCSGLAILSDSTRIFTGGSASAGDVHAIVRKLELGGATAARTAPLNVASAR